jgi:hypothetical protein
MVDFKETCIWMSYRYAIGRKSIASVSHARDIANHLDWIPENRRDFTARDILREVNDNVNWWKNIHIDSYTKEDCDVFTVIFEWFINNPQEDPIKYFIEHEWYVNLTHKTLEIDERKDPPQRNDSGFYYDSDIFNEYSDYKDWINLTKFIRGATHIATVDYKGRIEDIPVIEWYLCNTWGGKVEIEKCYTKADEFPGWHIAPEYITKIVPINK